MPFNRLDESCQALGSPAPPKAANGSQRRLTAAGLKKTDLKYGDGISSITRMTRAVWEKVKQRG
jgi:hypothetical protein